MKLSRTQSISLAIVAAFFVIVVGLVLVWDWSWFRGVVARSASDAIGRNVTLGDISVDLGGTTRMVLQDVAIGNAPWGEAQDLARAERIEVAIRIPALIRGDIDIPELVLVAPKVSLERNADGAANWKFGPQQESEDAETGEPPAVRRVVVEDGVLRYHDAQKDVALDLRIASAQARSGSDQDAGLTLTGTGRYQDKPFEIALKAGSIYALGGETEPFPVDLDARIGQNNLTVTGTLHAPLRLGAVDLQVEAKGPDIAGLAAVAGFEVPRTPAYAVRGRVLHEDASWSLQDLTARLGDSDLSGDLRFDPPDEARPRPKLAGSLASDLLDFEDFSAFIDRSAPAETPKDDGKETPQGVGTNGPLIPDVSFAIPALAFLDADVKLDARKIANAPVPLQAVAGHVLLDAGKLSLRELDVRAFETRLTGSASLHTGSNPVALDLVLNVGESKLSVKGAMANPAPAGAVDLRIHMEGPDLSGLAQLAGMSLPETPPFALAGQIVHKNETWDVRDLVAQLGKSDLSGNLRLAGPSKERPRPKLTGKLIAKAIDYDDFAAFTAGDDDQEATKKKKAKGADAAQRDRVIPDLPLDLPQLDHLDADVGLEIESIANMPGKLESLTGRVLLEAGKLVLDDIRLAASGGRFMGKATLDAGRTPTAVSLDAEMEKLPLGVLLPKGARASVSGQVGGQVRLAGVGASLVPLLGTLDGRLTLFLGGGKLDALLAEAIGLDILGTLRALLGEKNATTEIRCMVADFPVRKGVLTAESLVLDTNSVILTGSGTISLPKERLDLVLTPRARGLSPLSFSAPIAVSGTFGNPSVGPQVTGLGTTAGKTLALGLFLGPFGALVPMIENRLAGDGNCGALLGDIRSGEKDKAPPPTTPAPSAPAPSPPAPLAPPAKEPVP